MGAALLKFKRPDLPRSTHVSWASLMTAVCFVFLGLIGNLMLRAEVIPLFFCYFGAVLLIVGLMFERGIILKVMLKTIHFFSPSRGPRGSSSSSSSDDDGAYYNLDSGESAAPAATCCFCFDCAGFEQYLSDSYHDINSQKFVLFIKRADLSQINKGVLYVKNNELTQFLTIVHAEPPAWSSEAEAEAEQKMSAEHDRNGDHYGNDEKGTNGATNGSAETRKNAPAAAAAAAAASTAIVDGIASDTAQTNTEAMHEAVALIDQIYPKIKIDLVSIKDMQFGPVFVEYVSEAMNISKNKMFIMCPDSKFKHSLGAFGGVRVISGGSTGDGDGDGQG